MYTIVCIWFCIEYMIFADLVLCKDKTNFDITMFCNFQSDKYIIARRVRDNKWTTKYKI